MNVEKPRGKEREYKHFTMKPVKLMEHLIKIFTTEGQIVLDPFMGSASTGIACINTKRKFVGVELNQQYFLMSKNRLINHGNNKSFE